MTTKDELRLKYEEYLAASQHPRPQIFDLHDFSDPEFDEFKSALMLQSALEGLLRPSGQAEALLGERGDAMMKAFLISRVRTKPEYGASLVQYVDEVAEKAFHFLVYARNLRLPSYSVYAGEAPTGSVFGQLAPDTQGLVLVNCATNTMLSNVVRIASLTQEMVATFSMHPAFRETAKKHDIFQIDHSNKHSVLQRQEAVNLVADVLCRFWNLDMVGCDEHIEESLGHRFFHAIGNVALSPLIESGIAFIMCHEYGHVACGHKSSTEENELEADINAIRMLKVARSQMFGAVLKESTIGANRLVSYEADYVRASAELLFVLHEVISSAEEEATGRSSKSQYPSSKERIAQIHETEKGEITYGVSELDDGVAEHLEMIEFADIAAEFGLTIRDTSFLPILSNWFEDSKSELQEALVQRMKPIWKELMS